VIARDFSSNEPLPWSLTHAGELQLRSRLADDQIVIGSVLANRTGVTVGDRLRIERAGKSVPMTVAATVTDYNSGGLSVYMRRETALEKLGIDGVDMFLLNLDTSGRDEIEKRLTDFCVTSNLTKRSFDELQNFLDGMMSKVVAAFWGVLVVGLVIAGFGAFNTISMNVLEQTQEIALMRVIGMTGRQTRRMIVFQALILGFLSVIFGTFAGMTTAYVIHLCMSGLLMRVVAFHWRPAMILGCNLVAFLLLIPAALLPAWRATSNNISGALQNE
jgi:ABC-type antimicrobial peptide transport system permease subunit